MTLDIGTYNIKLLYGHYDNGYVIVSKVGVVRTPEGLIDNGQLDVGMATETIYDLLDNMGLKGKQLGAAVIESSAIVSRSFTLPYSNNADLQNMVTLEVERLFADVLQNYIVDYSCLDIKNDEDGSTADVMVFALPNKVFQSYDDTFINLSLQQSKLDILANAASKVFRQRVFVNEVAYPIDKTIALIDIGNSMMNIQIIDNGILKFCRSLKSGGEDITKVIASDLAVSFDEAEHMKINDVDLGALVHNSLYDSVARVVDDMTSEIQRVLRYYTTNINNTIIDSVFIYGGTSRLKNIAPYMSNILEINVIAIDTMNVIQLKQELPLDCYPSDFLNAAGTLMSL